MPMYRSRGIALVMGALLVACTGSGCVPNASNSTSSSDSASNDQDTLEDTRNDTDADVAARKPVDDLEATLPQIREAFFNNVEVYKQIYPPGWHKRRTHPTSAQWSVITGDAQTPGSKAVVKVTYEPRFSIIHETKKQAEADEDLVPYAPQSTRKEMTENPLNRHFEPIQISIQYERRNNGWIRMSWSAEPENGERPEWLDELEVP